uniref:Serpin family E member 3 n=1 Tax=Sphenodon punctatus TaxID=8508 RepID=A0A8D0GLE7_SPHPU
MLPLFLAMIILHVCFLNNGHCGLRDELKELKAGFALSLYQRIAELENRTNLVISPASVSVSLGLLQFGAGGNSFAQLERAHGYNIHGNDPLRKKITQVTNSSQGTVVQLACALFVQAGVPLSPCFIQHVTLWANSILQQANFSEPNRTAAQIDAWVTSNIGAPGGGGSPAMAVVSTMYFKSIWQRQFSFTDTQPLSFTTAEGFTLKVPTMYHNAEVNYGQFHTASLEQLSMVELPYLGETVSMFVVLPSNRKTSLAQIEPHLSAQTINLWANNLKRTKMDIFLLRFRIQSHFDLKMVLPILGITDVFDPIEADFKGISGLKNLYISEAIHKAKIEVTEDGTKASGATAMVLLKRSRAPVFKADRPFNFYLRQALPVEGEVLNTGLVLRG